MEEIEDEDAFPPNVALEKKNHVLELSDGSDNDEPMAPADTDNSDLDEASAKESEEAELGQLLS
jgi:hypothetical protein